MDHGQCLALHQSDGGVTMVPNWQDQSVCEELDLQVSEVETMLVEVGQSLPFVPDDPHTIFVHENAVPCNIRVRKCHWGMYAAVYSALAAISRGPEGM